jgi:hypothetical protein
VDVTRRQRLAAALPQLNAFVPALLVTPGLASIAYGVWSIYHPLGWIVAGLSCLGAEMWRTDRR